jgi:LysR family transcriptional regulator, regulatory protein for tcuABC
MGRAAAQLDMVTSALSQQISRLEGELSVRLLQRTKTGVQPTSAGLAFWHRAQLLLRNADDAIRAAKSGRLSGQIAVGFAPSTSGVVALPFMRAMRERYPDVSVRVVESLSGNLESMLTARQIDLAILFGGMPSRRFSVVPLLNERLFAISAARLGLSTKGKGMSISELSEFPLILPSAAHGLRVLIDAAFAKANCEMNVVAEIDGLATLMEAVGEGLGVTVQPGAALARCDANAFSTVPVQSGFLSRLNQLASLSDDELSPAGLAARVVMLDVVRELVTKNRWSGATLVQTPRGQETGQGLHIT